MPSFISSPKTDEAFFCISSFVTFVFKISILAHLSPVTSHKYHNADVTLAVRLNNFNYYSNKRLYKKKNKLLQSLSVVISLEKKLENWFFDYDYQ